MSLKNEFDRRNLPIAVVSFAEPDKLRPYQERHRWPFGMFADPDRSIYRAFALNRLSWFRVYSPGTLKLYWQLLRQGMKRENHGADDVYQAGGDFLLDREGNIMFAHRSRDPADRPSVAKILNAFDDAVGSKASLSG